MWIEDKSNEAYFSAIIMYLTPKLKYQNYKMIDSERELEISVVANKENKTIDAVYINGILNYFQKEGTKKVASHEIKTIEEISMSIQAKEINQLINNDWEVGKAAFGTVESRFENYDIYFDEGIEVKTIDSKVYNIIFTEKYKGTIVNGLKVNDEKGRIEKALGKPSFENSDLIGYKGDKIYVFFSKNEVSIYKVENDYKDEEFLKILKEFNETKNAVNFVETLTSLWTDYDEYTYDKMQVLLKYTLKGIEIKFNITGENGLIIYNNYKGPLAEGITLQNLNKDNLPEHVYLHTNIDLVFYKEEERVADLLFMDKEEARAMAESQEKENKEGNYIEYCFSEKENTNFYIIYDYTEEEGIANVRFASKDRSYPNSELTVHKQIYTYGWLNNYQFIYFFRKDYVEQEKMQLLELIELLLKETAILKLKEYKAKHYIMIIQALN